MNTFWQLLLVASPLVLLTVGLTVLSLSRSARNNNKAIPYAIAYGFGVSAWLVSLIYIAIVDDHLVAHRISFAAAYLIVVSALGLALTFPNARLTKRARTIMLADGVLSLIFGGFIFFTDLILSADNFYASPVEPFSAAGNLFLVVLGLHLPLIVSVFVRRYIREKRSRLLFNYIVLAFSFTALIAGITNLVLPLLSITDLVLGGPAAALLPFAAVVYALGIANINDFRYTLAQLLYTAGRLVLILLLLVAGYGLYHWAGVPYYSWRWVMSIAAIALAGIVLDYLLIPRVREVIDSKIIYSGQRPEEARSRLISNLSGKVELKQNISLILKFVKDTIGLKAAGIAIEGETGYVRSTGDFELSREELRTIDSWRAKNAGIQSRIIQRYRIPKGTDLYDLMMRKSILVIRPLRTEVEFKGYYLLGEKFSQEVFTRQDFTRLEMIIEIADLSIGRALFYDKIEAFNETLQHKVDEATKQLRHQNQRLKMLDQTKDDFISMASHQLRTPLTAVKGYISMVLEGDAGKVTGLQRRLLNQSFMSAQRMVYLISDLLNVSRLRTGKFELDLVPCNLSKLIDGELKQLKEAAQARNLELTFDKPEHFPTYMLDETKLRQVVMNFIDNAIYYTPSGGNISVILAEKPESIEFTVTDTGIGVPRSDQPHMFTKYFRAHNAQVARPDGTGLGLFMAKKVIIAHGGAVIFKSRERKGSQFGFSLPKRSLQTPPQK